MLPLLMRFGELALHSPVERDSFRHWRGFLLGGSGPDVELVVVTTPADEAVRWSLEALRAHEGDLVVGRWQRWMFAARPAPRGVSLATLIGASRAGGEGAMLPRELAAEVARACARAPTTLHAISPGAVLLGWDGTIACDGLDARAMGSAPSPFAIMSWAPVVAAALLGTVDPSACGGLVTRCVRDPRHAGIDEDIARAIEALTSSQRSAAAIRSDVEKALALVPRFDPAPLLVGLFPDLWRKDCDELAELSMAASVDLEPRAFAYGTLDGFDEPVDVVTQGDMLMHYDEAARTTVKDAVAELRRLVQGFERR